MNEFIELLTAETKSVIEGLTGISPKIVLKNEQKIEDSLRISDALALVFLKCAQGEIAFGLDVALATALTDMMLGGEGEEQLSMSEDDLDATKEIVSNISGAISTALSAQNDLPSLSFEIKDVEFFEEGSDFAPYNKLYISELNVANTTANMYLAVDNDFISNFQSVDDSLDRQEDIVERSQTLSPDELKNIELLMDVKLPVRVRIGTKTVLLKDVLSMDIGSVVELDQLANEPLDIFVGEKKIAKGEVVIVDGNFGVQIVEIGSAKEILSQIR